MDDIIIEPYNPVWPKMAKQEIAYLKNLLFFSWLVDIAHIGSTAIPGISAKSIIDIAIGVTDLSMARAMLPPVLEKEGYVFWRENPDTTKLFFVKGMPPFGEKRTHHIHVMHVTHHDWVVRPLFRDYLIAHPETRDAYAEVKTKLAEQFREDREAYTQAKTEFIRGVNRIAIKPYLQLSRLTKEDLPLLQTWLNEPHVKAWWDKDLSKYKSRLAPDSEVKCFIIKIHNVPIGFIQHYRSEEYKDAEGIDFFIGNPTFVGKGLGAFLLNAFIEKRLPEKIIVVDPDINNARAIRVYEKAGFRKVKESGEVVWMLRKRHASL